MEAAVAALEAFNADPDALEPEGWARTNHGAEFRRRARPGFSPDSEWIAP